MAVFIDLWPCLFTTRLSWALLFNQGHTSTYVVHSKFYESTFYFIIVLYAIGNELSMCCLEFLKSVIKRKILWHIHITFFCTMLSHFWNIIWTWLYIFAKLFLWSEIRANICQISHFYSNFLKLVIWVLMMVSS